MNEVSSQVWLWIAGAGAAGTLSRFALSRWVATAAGGTFPWGTLAVNVLGCFVVGVVAAAIQRGEIVSPAVRLALIVGFLGGFTTFSSFGLETYSLASGRGWMVAGGYVALTNVVGLAAVWAGHRLLG